MSTFNDTIRIFGDELDESDTYIDVKITGYSIDGQVKLVEDTDNGGRDWTVPETNLKDWRRKNLILSHEKMSNPDHEVWDTIAKLEDYADDEALGAAQSEIQKMTKRLFNESSKAQRSRGKGKAKGRNK